MIRQHFYPKTYYRHRSLSCKTAYKIDSFHQENYEKLKNLPGINARKNSINIKSNSHRKNMPQLNNQQASSCLVQDSSNFIQGVATQMFQQKSYLKRQIQETIEKKSVAKAGHHKISTSEHVNSEDQQFDTNFQVLKQINNNKISYRDNINSKILNHEEDFTNLFVKSDKKEITRQKRNSYKVLGHSNSENESFHWQSFKKTQRCLPKSSKTSRKLSSTDGSVIPTNTFRRSIQRKKKSIVSPAQINISSIQRKQNYGQKYQKREIQFETMTDNLISLNLSKAIKYRQQNKQQKIRKFRKLSQKIHLQFENKNTQLEQKVKGWEIQIQDDADFE